MKKAFSILLFAVAAVALMGAVMADAQVSVQLEQQPRRYH